MAGGERPTLVGVATGTPDGGVAVVRFSGPRAQAIVGSMVEGRLPTPRRLGRRAILVGGGGAHEDGLVVVMPGPRSFTGEDVVELHIHAGERNVRSVVDTGIARGAKAAGPGDFSRRAFELGRLGLDEAEGIAAMIGAQTDAALDQARRLAAGELGRQVQAQRDAVLELRAEVEANLDFPEDVDPRDVARWRDDAVALRDAVHGWLGRFEAGRRARMRARVVLAGPPNAGKSSLFNALLGHARALVAHVPGTTRDYVEAELALGRFGCVLVDTAGLREGHRLGDVTLGYKNDVTSSYGSDVTLADQAADAIERAGIDLSLDQIAGADVVIWVEAADQTPAVETQALSSSGAAVIRVETKRDLGRQRPDWVGVSLRGDRVQGVQAQGVQAQGVQGLCQALHRWFTAGENTAWIGLERHRDRAQEACDALDEAIAHLQDDQTLELAAFALGVAQARLGEIRGHSELGPVGEEVLTRIFAKFCIGK